MKLYELWNEPLPVKWIQKTEYAWEGDFTVGNIPYYIYIFNEKQADQKHSLLPPAIYEKYKDILQTEGVWEVEFKIDTNNIDYEQKEKMRAQRGSDYPFSILGTGNAIGVFSTILAALKEFVTQAHPSLIYFEAKEETRVKLYNRLVRQTKMKFEQFKFRGYTSYLIVNKQ
jgi:hypothetical protein